jgi:hypothetical protein
LVAGEPHRVRDAQLVLALQAVTDQHPIGPAAGSFVLERQPATVAEQQRLR